jgi:phage-related protein
MNRPEIKEIEWVGSSYKDLKNMPATIQDDIGFILWRIQEGKDHFNLRPLKGFRGVLEIISDYQTDTYRTVSAVKLGNKIYVLHVFKKKSKRGIAIPKEDIAVIRTRLQEAQRMAKKEE